MPVLVAAQRERAVHVVALRVEGQRLLARELALDGAPKVHGRQRGQVLHRDVLLAAKAAAHQHGLHHHALGLRVPAKHVRDFLAGVVGALVGAAHLHAILVREGDGALRLQKRVLRERRLEVVRHHVRGRGQRGLRVAARDVAALAHVVVKHHVVAKRVEALVHQGRALGLRLRDVAHGLQHLVVNLHQTLRLRERLLVLGHHQADGVTHAARDVALRDHHVPVLDQVAHLVHGHVAGEKNAHHARQRLGLRRVDALDACARVLRAHRARVAHVRKVLAREVVRVLAVAQHLAAHVHAEGALANPVRVALLERVVHLLVAAQDGRGLQDALHDLLVAGAAADVAADGPLDLLFRGVGVAAHQHGAAHDHAGDAEAALHGAHGAERVHKRLLLLVRKPLHGLDRAALGQPRGDDAPLGCDAVDAHGARSARALAAAVLHGREAHVVAQEAQQRLVLAGGDRLSVDGERKLLCHVFPTSRP